MKMLIAAILLVAVGAQARLGETNTDVANRYGPVTQRIALSTNEWRGVYTFKEFRVEVVFSNNVSVAEWVFAQRKFSDEEKAALVKMIGGVGEWTKLPLLDEWINTDTKAAARVDRVAVGQDALVVATRGFLDAQIARSARSKNDAGKSTAAGF